MSIKNSLLVDSGLLLEFWSEVIDITNHLQIRLFTKRQRGELFLEEQWTGKKQDESYVKVFGSVISVLIPPKKET